MAQEEWLKDGLGSQTLDKEGLMDSIFQVRLPAVDASFIVDETDARFGRVHLLCLGDHINSGS